MGPMVIMEKTAVPATNTMGWSEKLYSYRGNNNSGFPSHLAVCLLVYTRTRPWVLARVQGRRIRWEETAIMSNLQPNTLQGFASLMRIREPGPPCSSCCD